MPALRHPAIISNHASSSATLRSRAVSFHDTHQSASGHGSDSQLATEQQPSAALPVTYRERLGAYLHPRDMRRLVTPFSATNVPAIIVRRHVMLLNFDPLRAIVLRDRLLIIVPDGADSILNTLERRLRGGLDEVENEVFGVDDNEEGEDYTSNQISVDQLPSGTTGGPHDSKKEQDNYDILNKTTDNDDLDNEWKDINDRNWIEMAFELQAVDAVLSMVAMMLADEATQLQRKVKDAMDSLRGTTRRKSAPGEYDQEKLRILKDEVGEMQSRVQGFVRAMNLVLDEDEDMALMNLSRLLTHRERFIQPVSQEILEEESDEPELILEAYLQQSQFTVNMLELLKGNIDSTEELVTMVLDTVRNRLLFINSLIGIASLCVAIGSLVGSIFGMNVTNGLEEEEHLFPKIVLGTILGSLLLMGLLTLVLIGAINIVT